jgi:hypothetical protein
MRKSSIAWAIVAALSIAGAVWAQSSSATATPASPSELKVGDRVLGMTGFAVVGIALFLRQRRPRTI